MGVGSSDGKIGVGAGIVLPSNAGPKVPAAVGLIVDVEGERVESCGASPATGPLIVVGYCVGSTPTGVTVRDNAFGS